MKIIIPGLYLILAINPGLQAQDNISKSDWKPTGLIIDGNNKDWNLAFNFYDKSTGLQFDISNNSSHIFLFFMTNDNMKMTKMINAGWQIQLSSNEKSKKFSATIIFPAVTILENENVIDQNSIRSDIRSDMDFNSLINEYKLFLPGIKTKGFKTKNGDLQLIDTTGINIAIGSDSLNNLCYEISIPLNELIESNLIKLNELVQMNIKINPIKISAEDKKGNSEDLYGSRYYRQGTGSMNRSYGQGIQNYGTPYVGDMLQYNNARQEFRLTGNQ